MPSYVAILRPQAGTNLATNPSVEFATTGWTAQGGSIARSSAFQARGTYSLAVTPTATTTDGVYFTTPTLTAAAHTASIWVRGVSGIPYRIYFATTVPAIVGTPTTFTGTGQWQYVTVTATVTAAVHRIYIVKNASASTGVFYVDGLQVETGSTATTYIDGEQDGCYWNGEPHNSTSSRVPNDTNGGQWLDLADDLQNNLIEAQGIGMPPIAVAAQNYALLPGAFYQRSIARSRLMQFTVIASGTSWNNLHYRRNLLLAAVQPFRSGVAQPLTLRYTGSGSVNTIRAVYDSGLEMGQRNGFSETYGLRMVAHDPFWYSDQDAGTVVTSDQAFTVNHLTKQDPITGQWGSVGVAGGVNGTVFALTQWNGSVYVGGNFTTADGTANSNRIAVYTSSTNRWGTTTLGGVNSTVWALAVNQSGTVYVGGTFTTAGGTTVGRIAAWRPNNTWGTLLTGINGAGTRINALAISSDGTLYVGGTFTSAGGTTTANIAFWDGGAWGIMNSGVNQEVYALIVSPNGTVYAGGSFTQANGTTANYVAFWDKNNWGTMAGGLQTPVYALSYGVDGKVYAGGNFDPTILIVGSFQGAQWNGIGWTSLAIPSLNIAGETVRSLHFGYNNLLYAGGNRLSLVRDALALSWNSSNWNVTSVRTNSIDQLVTAIQTTPDNTLFVGGAFVSINAGISNVIVNNGTSPAEPVIRLRSDPIVSSSVILRSINNWTTNQSIYLNLVISPGETIYIDTRTGHVGMFSTWRGNVISSLLSGSELSSFFLAPGTNYITANTGSSNITVDIFFRERNWSADAV